MNIERGFQMAPNVAISPEGKYASGQNPFEMGGIYHFPAMSMSCGITQLASGDRMVQLLLVCTSPIGNSLGSFLRMTPEGARELAGFLIAQAVQVEAHVAEQARAAIEAARQRGGTAGDGAAA